jgi:hypothetical protein
MGRSLSRDLSIDPGRATLRGVPLSIAALLVVLVPHQLIHGEDALKALFRAVGGWWFAPLLVAGIALHEALHGVTWVVAGGLRARDLEVGVHWRFLMPYAHPRRPLAAWAYALGAAMPGVLLGVVPAVAGLWTGVGPWSGWGAIFLAAACGDAMVIYSLRGLEPSARVQDHPTRVGCEVVADE